MLLRRRPALRATEGKPTCARQREAGEEGWLRWRLLRRIHNELVDLAFLKRRLRWTSGDRGQIGEQIEGQRERIAFLRSLEAIA